jgi:hypothetical protein
MDPAVRADMTLPVESATPAFAPDAVAKVENRATLKIPRKSMANISTAALHA